MPITNYTDLINITGLLNYSMASYTNILLVFTYPLIFCGIIGYVYIKQQSVIAAAVVTLILFGAFSSLVVKSGIFITIMHIFVTIAVGALFLLLFTRWRQ